MARGRADRGRPAPEPGAVGDSDVEAVRSALGRRLRALRLERQMSVRALAEASGVTGGFLSQVENGHVMPSVATLIRLGTVLETRVGELFDHIAPLSRVVRADERQTYGFSEHGVHDEVLSADPTGELEVLLSRIEAGSGTGRDLYTHGTRVEVVHVLSGAITVRVGAESLELGPGDSLTFTGEAPHGVANDGDETAELIWVATPARY
jgi:transcriptional regulator with XRE-family HTH domain